MEAPDWHNAVNIHSKVHNLLANIRLFLNNFLQSLHTRVRLRVAVGIVIIVLMANLDAIVDSVIHPEVAYFDREHLIVGAVTGIVTTFLFGMLSIYVASLKRAMREIRTLEGLLPICSSCKMIRTPDDHWHHLEKYITERTEATFTHGLCPECAQRMYPEMYAQKQQEREKARA